jgi:phage terminase large subunit-like protein|nr:MAG TPA: Large Terminase [Caudoviricetes sp.]
MLSNTAVPIEYGKFRDAVCRGQIPVNEMISLQMNRIDARIRSRDYYYDDEAIKGFCDFCENEMTLMDGSPLTLLPSFRLWAEDLLAWFYYREERYYDQKHKRFKTRRVLRRLTNIQYLIVARGAAKSMYAAFIQAYYLFVDTSSTQQITVAPTKLQADEVLSPIRIALTRHPGPLFKFLTSGNKLSTNEVTKQKAASTKRGIENFLTRSLLEIRTMSIDKIQGARSKVNSVDEWLSGDVKENVIEAMVQSAAKGDIDDYVVLAISSEGTVRDGVGDTIKMELIDILRGNIEDEHVSIWYYRMDNVREIKYPELWIKANPNLGATVSYETYERDVVKAEKVPAKRNDILAKRFGIPVEGYTYFFTYEETLCHGRQNFDNMECSMGADLSQGDDFCAFTFLFPLGRGRYGVKTRAYVCENKVFKLPKALQDKYQTFVDEGTLVIIRRSVLQMMEVYDDLDEFILKHQYTVTSFGYDAYNSEAFINRWCTENGDYGVTRVIQGARTESVPLGELKKLAEDRCLIFDEELMKFAMGNSIVIEDNNGNYKLSKKRSQEKIDNVSALMDAWVAYRRSQEDYSE